MKITSSIWLLALSAVFFSDTAKSASPILTASINSDSFEYKKLNIRAESKVINLNYRLPNDTYPEHYAIQITTNVHKGERSFKGNVIIDILVVTTTSNIVLHARNIDISKVNILNPSTGESEELLYENELEREFLILTRKNNQQFVAETKWKLAITYNGKIGNGLILTEYIDGEGHDHYLVTTRFESTYARYVFPCYDEPNIRANFTITINHSPSYNAISNMPVNEALSSAANTVFLTTARIPTYTVAFVVSDFEYTEGIRNGLPQRVYSRPNAKDEHSLALVTGALIAEQLSGYYGVELMIPKMDHVAIPDFFNKETENWGVATYIEGNLLYNNQISTEFDQTNIAKAIANAMSHQWFGNYVTIQWWTYLWLKEGLSTLSSYRALDNIYPELGLWQQFHSDEYQRALYGEAVYSPKPLTSYVQKPNEIASAYNTVSKCKAASVLLMWNNALTDQVFQKSLRNFLVKNQYSAVSEEQLFTAIQTAVKEEKYIIPARISEMLSTWTHQGGYPVLTVTRNYEDDTFSIKQETFFLDEAIQDNKTWYVPINYALASDPDFLDTKATHYLCNVAETKVDDDNIGKRDWLIVNKQSTGFYRVNYDADNWNLIAEGLIENPFSIHVRNRAQLMDDAYHFTISNRLKHAVLLKLLSYLKQEDQYAPWSTANKIITTYIPYLRGDEKYNDFKSYIAEQVSPIYKKLGVIDVPGENHNNKYIRNLVINMACTVGVKECLEETNSKLEDLVTENTAIEANPSKIIYCNGLRQTGDDLFDTIYQKVLNSTKPFMQFQLITALGCTQNKNQIKKFISKSIDKSQNLLLYARYSILKAVYLHGEVGLLACMEFLSENWNTYGSMGFGVSPLKPLDMDIRGMAKYVVNKQQEEQLLALVAKVKNSKYVKASLESSVKERIANNYQWIKYHGKPIMSWISQYRVGNGNGDNNNLT